MRVSKYRGVYRARTGKYTANITINGVSRYLGTFKCADAAARVRDMAYNHHKATDVVPSAPLNFPMEWRSMDIFEIRRRTLKRKSYIEKLERAGVGARDIVDAICADETPNMTETVDGAIPVQQSEDAFHGILRAVTALEDKVRAAGKGAFDTLSADGVGKELAKLRLIETFYAKIDQAEKYYNTVLAKL